MSDFNRRSVLKASLGGAALLAGPGIVPVRAAEWTNTPEPNASIRMLRMAPEPASTRSLNRSRSRNGSKRIRVMSCSSVFGVTPFV